MRCLHNGCTLDGWIDPDDANRRSHFCLDHAWSAMKHGIVATAPQYIEFDKFDDALVVDRDVLSGRPETAEYRYTNLDLSFIFPESYAKKTKTFIRKGMQNTCWRCGSAIVSRAFRCGKCQKAERIYEDYTAKDILVRCEHWRDVHEPGHMLLKECKRDVPSKMLRTFHGNKWCTHCIMYVSGISKQERIKHGYEF